MNLSQLSKLFFIFLLFFSVAHLNAQNTNDLKKSVPLWFEYDEDNNDAALYWINDPGATNYTVSSVNYSKLNPVVKRVGTVAADVDSFLIENFEKGISYRYRVSKSTGMGFIDFGIEQPYTPKRGRCLLVLDDLFTTDLEADIKIWMDDIRSDGWSVDTIWVSRGSKVPFVKQRIVSWSKKNYPLSQSVILFGHIPVPYSGSTAIDGHAPDHTGAWPADVFYADIDGNWTDVSVNISEANRPETNNIPGDGKYDQVILPSDAELEIGRIDFFDLPAFSLSEKELLIKYLQKNHNWRRGLNVYPNSAIMENNFGGYDEGFGQNAWRNFMPMFGKDNTSEKDYENTINTEKHVFSFAAGAGSYTSCGGIGSTQNLWAAKELKTVFTMTFGSYFGDWDNKNNFLRGALASGDILTNVWAGRPNWLFYPMASGAHIGYCTRLTQNANDNTFSMGYGARYAHTALLGDPTLTLHPVSPVLSVNAEMVGDSLVISWEASDATQDRFLLYYSTDGTLDEFIEINNSTSYTFPCFPTGTELEFMVRPVVLTTSASGSYYNLGSGNIITYKSDVQNMPVSAFTQLNNYEVVSFTNQSVDAVKYLWDFGDGETSDLAEPVHIYKNKGTYTICLTASISACISDTNCKSIEVVSSLPEKVLVEPIEPLCFGDLNGVIGIDLQGGSLNNLTYLWSNGSTNKDLINVGAGSYSITITSTISGNTFVVPSIELNAPNEIKVEVNVTPSSGTDGIAVFEVSGGIKPYSFKWSPEVVDDTHLAPGEYTVTIKDANNCQKVVTFIVEMSTSTSELNQHVGLYPNPATDFIHIHFVEQDCTVSLIEQGGRVVKIFTEAEVNNKLLDIRSIVSGLYFVVVKSNNSKMIIAPVVIMR